MHIDTMSIDELPSIDPFEAPAADKPPRRGRRKATAAAPEPIGDKPPKQPRAPRRPRQPPLKDRLTDTIVTIGTLAAMASPADGVVIVEGAPRLADSLGRLADENPRVRKSLERMMSAGAWSGVLAAAAPIALGIAANHGVLPPAVAASLAPREPEAAAA